MTTENENDPKQPPTDDRMPNEKSQAAALRAAGEAMIAEAKQRAIASVTDRPVAPPFDAADAGTRPVRTCPHCGKAI